jgi:hypothetical protein
VCEKDDDRQRNGLRVFQRAAAATSARTQATHIAPPFTLGPDAGAQKGGDGYGNDIMYLGGRSGCPGIDRWAAA